MEYTVEMCEKKEAPWVVMIHGLGGNQRIWYKQREAVKTRCHAIYIDLPGHGESSSRKGPSLDVLKEICADIRTIMERHHVSSAIFSGVSIGSIIARMMNKEYPEKVRGMILTGAVLRFRWKEKAYLFSARVGAHVLRPLTLYRVFAKIILPRKNHRLSREVFVKEARKLKEGDFFFWFRAFRCMKMIDGYIESDKVEKITVCITGEQDHIFRSTIAKAEEEEEHLHQWVIPGAGHLCNIDRAEYFNSTFLQAVERVQQREG